MWEKARTNKNADSCGQPMPLHLVIRPRIKLESEVHCIGEELASRDPEDIRGPCNLCTYQHANKTYNLWITSHSAKFSARTDLTNVMLKIPNIG